MPMHEDRREAVEFLLELVCGAPPERLVDEWRRLGRLGRRRVVLSEASRLNVAAALGRFCEALPAEDVDDSAVEAAAALAFSRGRVEAVLGLVLDLCRARCLSVRRAVLVKGAALSLAGLYAGERELGDADLLVEAAATEDWRLASRAAGAEWREQEDEGYEVAGIRRAGALVELHVALPGDGGKVCGPGFAAVWDRSVPVAAETAVDLRVPDSESAREIAVHHAVFHHRGDPEYVMRALQDVARLEVAGAGASGRTLFPEPEVVGAVAHFRAAAKQAARPLAAEGEADTAFASGLLRIGVASREERFARGVDGWLAAARRDGRSPFAFALRQAVGQETGPAGLAGRLAKLAVRYVAGRTLPGARRRRRAEEEWISFLSGRGARTRAS